MNDKNTTGKTAETAYLEKELTFRHCYRYRLWLEEEEEEEVEEEKEKEEECHGHNKEKPEEIHKQKPIIVN